MRHRYHTHYISFSSKSNRMPRTRKSQKSTMEEEEEKEEKLFCDDKFLVKPAVCTTKEVHKNPVHEKIQTVSSAVRVCNDLKKVQRNLADLQSQRLLQSLRITLSWDPEILITWDYTGVDNGNGAICTGESLIRLQYKGKGGEKIVATFEDESYYCEFHDIGRSRTAEFSCTHEDADELIAWDAVDKVFNGDESVEDIEGGPFSDRDDSEELRILAGKEEAVQKILTDPEQAHPLFLLLAMANARWTASKIACYRVFNIHSFTREIRKQCKKVVGACFDDDKSDDDDK